MEAFYILCLKNKACGFFWFSLLKGHQGGFMCVDGKSWFHIYSRTKKVQSMDTNEQKYVCPIFMIHCIVFFILVEQLCFITAIMIYL